MLEGRDWFRMEGATPAELAELQALAPGKLPARYLELLAFSNGGEGPLAMPPYNLCLDSATVVAESITSANQGQPDLQGFLIFGGNGGGEYLAFDTRHDAHWPIVTIDMVAGRDSAEVIAADFDSFFDGIGIEDQAA